MAIDKPALRIAGLYAVLGMAWIAVSGRFMLAFAPDIVFFPQIGVWKGTIIILVTAFALYLGLNRYALRHVYPAKTSSLEANAKPPIRGFVALAAVVVMAGLSAASYLASQQKEREIGKLQAVGNLKASQVETWMAERKGDAQNIHTNEYLAELYQRNDEASRGKLLKRLESYRNAYHYKRVLLLDERGNVLMLAGSTHLDSPRLRDTVRRAIAEDRVLDTDLYRLEDGAGEVHLEFVAPLPSAAGQPRLAVVLDADPEQFLFPFIQSWPVPSASAETLLFRRDGDNVLFLNQLRYRQDAALKLRIPFSREKLLAVQVAAGQVAVGGAVEGVDYRGVPVLGVARAISGTSWSLVAKMDKDELYTQSRRDAAWIILGGTLALILVAAAAIVVLQRRDLHSSLIQREQQEGKLRALQLLDAIAEASTDIIFVKDAAGRYLLANPAAAAFLGKTQEEMLGKDDAALFPPDKAERVRAIDQEILRGGKIKAYENDLPSADGARALLETKGPLRNERGEVIGLFGVARDITERKRAEEKMRQAAMVFESTQDGVSITDPAGRILAVNHAFTKVTGYAEAEVLGRNPRILKSGQQGEEFYRELWATLLKTGSWQGEVWNRRKDGETYPEFLTISAVHDEQGNVTNYVGVFTDISQLWRSKKDLEHLAHYDPLTDLPNRLLVQSRLEHALERAQRHGHRVGMLYLDLDHFKTVTDSLGHHAGDDLLVFVARRLKGRLREEDTLGRLGGDEFLIVLESLNGPQDAALVAGNILAALVEPFDLPSSQEVFISTSIGIGIFPEDGATSAELLRNADTAMYRAKDRGRNQFCFYTGDMNVDALARLELEAALRRALERNELLLHYQPKVDLKTGCMSGAEALIRWQREGVGLVPPVQFIPLAEKSDLIVSIGNWAIDAACREIRGWLDAGLPDVHVAVNLSARQFRSGELDGIVAAALEKYGVAPGCLELEVTESMLMERPDEAVLMLNKLKQIGVKLSLDDFGTGYSSLTYLMRFPIDNLKIDQSFVRDIVSDPDSAAIAASIIALAHRMRLKVVAEGVETEAQLGYLRMRGCDEMQGYYFSKPVPAGAFFEMMQTGKALPPVEPEAPEARTLLIVDDEPDILAALRCSLRGGGYRILSAGSAREGLEILACNAVHVILSDQCMPEMSGTEFMDRVKELHPNTVRIVLSGYTNLESITRAVNEGTLYKFISKPWDNDLLREHMRDAFRYYEAVVQPRIAPP